MSTVKGDRTVRLMWRGASSRTYARSLATLLLALLLIVVAPVAATYPYGGSHSRACEIGATENPPTMDVFDAAGIQPEAAVRLMRTESSPLLGYVDCIVVDRAGEVLWTDRVRLVPVWLLLALWAVLLSSAAMAWLSRPTPSHAE